MLHRREAAKVQGSDSPPLHLQGRWTTEGGGGAFFDPRKTPPSVLRTATSPGNPGRIKKKGGPLLDRPSLSPLEKRSVLHAQPRSGAAAGGGGGGAAGGGGGGAGSAAGGGGGGAGGT